jgi:hypothetical protein
LEIKQNHLSIPKLSGIFYQFRDVQTYSHQPRYTADDNAAGNDVQAQKCQLIVLAPC